MAGSKAPLPDDGIYRAILLVLVISLLAGAAISLAGEYILQSKPVSRAGAWLAIVSGAVYFFFRWFGRREARRRTEDQDPGDDDPGEDDPGDDDPGDDDPGDDDPQGPSGRDR
jgi:hypothetical protein